MGLIPVQDGVQAPLEELDEEELLDELDEELLLDDEEELDEGVLQNAAPGMSSPLVSSKQPCSPKKQTGTKLLLHAAINPPGVIKLSFVSQIGQSASPEDELDELLELEEDKIHVPSKNLPPP